MRMRSSVAGHVFLVVLLLSAPLVSISLTLTPSSIGLTLTPSGKLTARPGRSGQVWAVTFGSCCVQQLSTWASCDNCFKCCADSKAAAASQALDGR